MWNFRGNNTWTGTVILGSPAPVGADVTINVGNDAAGAQTRLFLTGVIQDVIPPSGPFNLIKIGQGDLVLSPTNQSTGIGTPNLFKGTTDITAGSVTLRDSQGFGPKTKRNLAGYTLPIAFVRNGASLNLESNVGHIDSVTGTINRLDVSAPLRIEGAGILNFGAPRSISGLNMYSEKFVTSPVQNNVTGVVGGSLAPGTTYWVATALDGYGESLASNERSFVIGGAATRTARITWAQVPGTIGYRIYRSTTPSTCGATSRVTTINNGSTTSFDDDGVAPLQAGAPPTAFPVIDLAASAAIGVDAEPNQTPNNSYFTDDYSLTITGGISDAPTEILSKVGAGHLILPNANDRLRGDTDIKTGWVTIQQPSALGPKGNDVQELERKVTVSNGAALMFRPLVAGTNMEFTQNLVLEGIGITHPFSLINRQGALENLSGFNTIGGNIQFKGQVGIGVEEVFGASHLYLTGAQSQGRGNFGGIVKIGSQRLDIRGPGTFQGGVDIQHGVVRVENNSALGTPGNSGTIVQAGAALELANTDPTPGSILGAGNFGVSIANPNIDIYPNSRLIIDGDISDAGNPTTLGTDLIMNGGGSLVLAGNNSRTRRRASQRLRRHPCRRYRPTATRRRHHRQRRTARHPGHRQQPAVGGADLHRRLDQHRADWHFHPQLQRR